MFLLTLLIDYNYYVQESGIIFTIHIFISLRLTLKMKRMNTTDFLMVLAMTSPVVTGCCQAASIESRISFHLVGKTARLCVTQLVL